MWSFHFLLLQFVTIQIQSVRYRLEHEAVKVGYYDKNYIRNADASLFQFNGTSKAYNISVTPAKDLPSDFRVNIEPYKFQGNAWRRFPTDLSPKFCDMFERNDFGIRMVYNYSNFRKCPVKANVTYYVNNFILDDRRIPSQALIPGKFKLDGTITNKTFSYAKFEWFVSVVPFNH